MLRDGALSRRDVIDFVNAEMVPVWINIRKQPFPYVPSTAWTEWGLLLTGDRKVSHPYFYYYYIRSFVLSPDRNTLLNDEDGLLNQVWGSGPEYLEMLRASLKRWRDRQRPIIAQARPAANKPESG